MKVLIQFKDKFPNLGQNIFVTEGTKTIGEVEMGDKSSVWFNHVLRDGVNFIKIGKGTDIQDLTTIHMWYREFNRDGGLKDADLPTRIGNDVTTGHNCVIHACKIGSRMPMGVDAMITDDATIGGDSIVGTGSAIIRGKRFPSKSPIFGDPAKLIHKLDDKEVASLKQSALNYVESKNDFLD